MSLLDRGKAREEAGTISEPLGLQMFHELCGLYPRKLFHFRDVVGIEAVLWSTEKGILIE